MEKENEIDIIRLGVERQIQLLGIPTEEIKGYHGFNTSLSNRMGKKIKLLIEKYGKDLKYTKTVIPLVLGFERQKQLLGAEEANVMSDLGGILSYDFQKYLKEQMGLKNYNFVLNMGYHIELERQRQLLGVHDSDSDSEEIAPELHMAMNFNRFALNLDLDFVFEKVDDEDNLELKATGTMSTKDKVYVSLYLDNCSWRMVLYEADFRDADKQRTAIPLKAKSGEKTVRDKDDNLLTYSYSGPEDMVAFLPEFKIDLCDISKKDSAFMMPITYTYDYTPSGPDLKTSYKEDMLAIGNHMFIDKNKLEESGNEVMDIATEIIDNVSQSQVTDPTGNPKLDKMQNEYNFKLKQDSYKKKLSNTGMNKKSVFLFNANNGSTVFIDQTNDTRHTIDENTKLVKGLIHLRVVHDPVTN